MVQLLDADPDILSMGPRKVYNGTLWYIIENCKSNILWCVMAYYDILVNYSILSYIMLKISQKVLFRVDMETP